MCFETQNKVVAVLTEALTHSGCVPGNTDRLMPLFMRLCQSPVINGGEVAPPLGSLQACVSQQVWASPGRGCVWTHTHGDSSKIVFSFKFSTNRQDKALWGVTIGKS